MSQGPYGNFEDPLGLVKRMLRSRDSAAWWALGLASASKLTAPLDRMLTRWEPDLDSTNEETGPMLLLERFPSIRLAPGRALETLTAFEVGRSSREVDDAIGQRIEETLSRLRSEAPELEYSDREQDSR